MKLLVNYTNEVKIPSTEYDVESLKDVYIKDDIWLVIYERTKGLSFIALRYIHRYYFDKVEKEELDEYAESQSIANK